MNIKFGVDIYALEEVNELARASIGYIESDVMDIKKRYTSRREHEQEQCEENGQDCRECQDLVIKEQEVAGHERYNTDS